ncbi:MAG: hypothetical protein MJ191_02650 [Clostridium sp.]|nr:hypothetical protein [Clostridium sp.]
MKAKITKSDKYFIAILIILFISFILNCYQVTVNKRYKRIIESTFYGNIEEIRIKNENVLSILDRCIKTENISNEELLKLYKNYSAIASAETELLEHYLEYKDNPNIKTSNKNVSIENENVNSIYWQIEEIIYNYIKSDLNKKEESMKLNNENLNEISVLKEMAEKLNQYYISFYEENCSNLNEDSRADKIIRHAYWIDILKGIQNINQEYIDYEFFSKEIN